MYYFVQPKTSGITIINDILRQIESMRTAEAEHKTKDQPDVTTSDVTSHKRDIPSTSRKESFSDIKLGVRSAPEKVIPLSIQETAIIKVFMMHSVPKSALANAPFAAGFQQQVGRFKEDYSSS